MTTGGIIMTFVLILWFTFIFLHSRSDSQRKLIEEEQKARQKAAKEKEKQDDLSFISSVADILPDSDAALSELITRFGWNQVVGVLGLGSLEFRILKSVQREKNITLPNMQANRYTKKEHHVVNEIRKTTLPYDYATDITCIEEIDYVGSDNLAQEPTAKMLSELVQSGYIKTADKISNNCRNFECELTSNGNALLKLNNRFCNCTQLAKRPFYEEERKVIYRVIQLCIQ